MKRRIKRIAGQIIKTASVVAGLYLIAITFGWKPLYYIVKLWRTESGLLLIGKTALQLLKMMFGMGYTMMGMIILYRIGDSFCE